MQQPSHIFKYHCRPGYGSGNLLLEFFLENRQEAFCLALKTALKELGIKLVTDRIQPHFSEVRLFSLFIQKKELRLTIDTSLDSAFIQSDEYQYLIENIDMVLMTQSQFMKEQVNFDDFRTAQNQREPQ